ncbi:DUF3742 family protein [Pseudomonas chengduensis]|uniref:DUF3742 family protein n=1 Tax=Pseudomonas sediminis TaxID=1691904 RepID=UPI00244C9133|nr:MULTISPECIES: DUF3742 family protein [Pseudomonas]MDG9757825.1 DUF3742 family protein [Pseudomonas sediminis]MDH0622969.1 DUF3742 family protein [Pseudomonas chengduensis]MDH1664536.1 DUF3742 family protein [Pseudomonas chengduensis]
MKSSAQTSFAERFGQMLGRMWRGYLRQERKVNGWFVARGVPAGGASVLLWIVKLVVFGVLLYVAFWFVLLLVFALLAARGLAQNGPDEDLWAQKDELRYGEDGYGLYSSSGQRIDPHDPNNPYDE